MADRFRIIEIALSQYGTKEIAGEQDNPEVMKYFHEIGHTWVKDDETSWCSAFANWVLKRANEVGSGKLDARSWLRVGAETKDPEVGDIVVLWRESKSSWKGHVGFYINHDDKNVYILGGNQSNQVCIQVYPLNRLLSYQRI